MELALQLEEFSHSQVFVQILLTFFLVMPIILISRTIVSGTKYSPILIIVIFGLAMGFIMVKSDVATPGLEEFPVIILMSKVTITALVATFFVGGQEIKKILSKEKLDVEDLMVPSTEEVLLGTKRTQLLFIVRAFFILLGIEGVTRFATGSDASSLLSSTYPIIGYLGLAISVILIDNKANISNRSKYILKGLYEILVIVAILLASYYIALWVKPVIALPQIFFAMIISAALGAIFSKWTFGPTLRALLFAGIPVTLAANFIVGGSQISEALKLIELRPVLVFGLSGQLFWMFGGLAIMILLGRVNHLRNLAPGIAGGLSHSGLTGACTAGDLGHEAASRAPIMINIPFFGHIFVFSILAASASRGELLVGWVVPLVALGLALIILALSLFRKSNNEDAKEIKALMIFSFGLQVVAVFGTFLMLDLMGMSIENASMAASSAISHFGLFAAVQGGMFGESAAAMIPFIFAMPFLIHPFVFGMFGNAAKNNGIMSAKITYILAMIGLVGIIACFFIA